jgi:hypothetical protein
MAKSKGRTSQQVADRVYKGIRANHLLAWMIENKKKEGMNVAINILDDYCSQFNLDIEEAWTNWTTLKLTGRVRSRSCWEWARLRRKGIKTDIATGEWA